MPEPLRRLAAEFGWYIGFAAEPDGRIWWGVLGGATGELLQHGHADTWDDARLAAIENLYPPSDEEAG